MSIYHCSRCERFCDNDYDPCTIDPKNGLELMCENCTADAEEAAADSVPARPAFTKEQQAIIDQIVSQAQEPA